MDVLIVDDDPANRDLLSRMLRRLACDAEAVADQAGALAACGRRRFDLVFMDLGLPDADGYACARAVLELYRRQAEPEGQAPHRPRIIASSGADGLEPDSAELFDQFLQKPYGLSELKAALSPENLRIP